MRLSIVLLYLVLVGCGSSRSTSINPKDLSGNWTGMLNSSNVSHSRTLDIFITQIGTSLNEPRLQLGVAKVLTGCYGLSGTLTGNVSNSQTSFIIVIPAVLPSFEEDLTLTGTVQSNSVSGNYTETAGCLKGESGMFQISRAPSITSSQWSGTWYGPYGSSASASATLAEDSSANVSGTLTLGGSGCDGFGVDPATVTGNLTGVLLNITASTPSGSWAVPGHLDLSGKSLALSHVCTDSLDRAMDIILTHS